jgi:hypothetical protein
MAEGAMAVSVEPDLGGNDGQGGGLALRTIHENTSGAKNISKCKKDNLRRNLTVIFSLLIFQQLMYKSEH